MSKDGALKIWTPDGMKSLDDAKPLDRVELRPGLAEWFYQFNDFAQHFKLGLHCSICKADIVGKNAPTDRVFTGACACREFVGKNRDYREPPKAATH
jgi:hypothetical protein